jgi:hypothetical protein
MGDTMIVDSAVIRISSALKYDACERLLAEGASLESAYKLAAAQIVAADNNDHGPDSTRETALGINPIQAIVALVSVAA